MKPYSYQDVRESLFTDDGQRMFLLIRDNTMKLIAAAGVVRLGQAIKGVSGDSWMMMACLDRMVELGEIREVNYGDCAGQLRIFEHVNFRGL